MKNLQLNKLTLSALFVAIGLVLPFFTGQIPEIGSALLPMHLPVLVCGILCGPRYGGIVGFITPLMRSLLFGMPPLFPTALAMAFELACYAIVIGLVYQRLEGKKWQTLLALLSAMVAGRLVWGAVSFLLLGFSGSGFSPDAFLAGALFTALPGIVLQLLLVPLLIAGLKHAKVPIPLAKTKNNGKAS